MIDVGNLDECMELMPIIVCDNIGTVHQGLYVLLKIHSAQGSQFHRAGIGTETNFPCQISHFYLEEMTSHHKMIAV